MKLYYLEQENSFSKDAWDTSSIFEAIDEYMTTNGLSNAQFNQMLQRNIPFQKSDIFEYEIQDVFEYIGYSHYFVEVTITKVEKVRVVAKDPMQAEKIARLHYPDNHVECRVEF